MCIRDRSNRSATTGPASWASFIQDLGWISVARRRRVEARTGCAPWPTKWPFKASSSSCQTSLRVWDLEAAISIHFSTVSYTHLRAHETPEHLVCRLLLE